MKTNLLKTFFVALFLITATGINAHDFEADGIFYNITDATAKTVEVTYKGSSYSEYNEYSGSIIIPSSVTYNNTVYSITGIGNYAFLDCTSLTSVEIPNSVTSIGEEAFNGCSGLTSIEIPSSVRSIGHNAFNGCSGLTSIVIPNSVTTIGSYAFTNCSGLTSIVVDDGNSVYDSREGCNAIIKTASNTLVAGCKNTVIPNSVTTIGYYAFYGCTGLTSIEIPTGVTAIDVWAFSGCRGLTSVVIPNSVTSIGYAAFHGCRGLTSVVIPNSVTTIGSSAFSGCSGLTSIEIPTGVTAIDVWAFSNCSGLTSIVIPNSVTTIGVGAFSGCSGLASIVVDDGNSVYDSRGGCNAIIETASNALIAGCENTVIPNSVTTIGYRAFYDCSGLTSIEIPNSVTSIGDYAFIDCTGLTNVVIPNSVTSIGDYAFRYCTSLTSVISYATATPAIGASVFDRISSSAVLHYPAGSDYSSWAQYFASTKEFTIPKYRVISESEKTAEIIASTEKYVGNVVIPSIIDGYTITGIGERAFYGCEGLTNVEIHASVTSIGNNAFNGCYGLTSIEIPNSVTSIGGYAFVDCTGLTNVVIPNSVTTIGSSAFSYCCGLTSIEIPNSVTSIGSNAFNQCRSLTNVTITDNVKSIGNSAFQYCDLRSIHIPASVESIEDYAFTWNLNLSSITVDKDNPVYYVPDGYENIIMERATNKIVFACGGATIPQTATAIGAGAFNGVGGIESVTIHANITGIGDWAFDGCRDLKTIYALSETPLEISSNVFFNASSATTLYVPYGAKEAYEAAEGWRNFTNIVEIQEVTITISEYGTATYCSEYALDFSEVEGLKAYAATGYNTATQVVTLTRVQTAVEETGLFLMGEPGEYVVPVIDFSNDYTLNLLIGTLEETTVNNKTDDGNYVNFKYTIANGDSRPMFYQFEDNSILSAGKAYLQLPARLFPSTASRSIGIRFDEGTATDIDEVECDDVYDAEAVYDMQGRKVKNPVNGIYIIGGKKVIIK